MFYFGFLCAQQCSPHGLTVVILFFAFAKVCGVVGIGLPSFVVSRCVYYFSQSLFCRLMKQIAHVTSSYCNQASLMLLHSVSIGLQGHVMIFYKTGSG